MERRAFLKTVARAGALSAAAGLPAPAISQRASSRTLRLVPHADLANFDPIWNSAYIARNAGLLVWDTLYGIDSNLQPQQQMVESDEVSANGLTWTFRLRSGLKFHDGEPVLARDAVASINRWSARDPTGRMIKSIANEIAAFDDRSFRWSLKKPFPKMRLALGKANTPCCFIMPTRIAGTDPFNKISEYVGSGPTRFLKDEWVPGARAVFEKFRDYVPRQEPSSWLAGGKRILVDRIEWHVTPDAAIATAALQSGEVDWLEHVLPDLAPVLRKNGKVTVQSCDPLGYVAVLMMNHLYPPFDDVRARRALLLALSQQDYMRAFVGDDNRLWRPMPSYFAPGTPLYNEEGADILKGPRDLDAAKRLLEEGGYAGQPVTLMAAQDQPHHKAWGDVTVDLLNRLGIKVDFVATDWGTVVARSRQKLPLGKGGWNMYPTSLAGANCVDPTNNYLRADGSMAGTGWPQDPKVETQTAAWFDAKNFDEERLTARRLNKAAFDYVIYAPTGSYQRLWAWRSELTGVVQGPAPFFWGVGKAA